MRERNKQNEETIDSAVLVKFDRPITWCDLLSLIRQMISNSRHFKDDFLLGFVQLCFKATMKHKNPPLKCFLRIFCPGGETPIRSVPFRRLLLNDDALNVADDVLRNVVNVVIIVTSQIRFLH